MGRIYKLVPIKDKNMLSLTWFLDESMHKNYYNSPGHYFSHLIGHEGENSLLSYLKLQHYAYELSAGAHDELFN